MPVPEIFEDDAPTIDHCAQRLAEHVASVHQETGEFGVLSIVLKGIVVDGVAMGDYEVVVQQTRPPQFLELEAER
ncbi:hypothetical protein BTR14_16335 [Rhizobium rhizosphaerae]|uniref:Uncharacterized protein n=1 Tax=Xaviernesmea rhizosphaerae TaxID=1672749 RepID=A0ABX3P9R3_9HYPH|nr:hypothetical protein [Xaviernesmea rhizosphaerae]OQP85211.1 hypothetical protein BTR14_16335 [Xaviernesmea rhizosphaerae]